MTIKIEEAKSRAKILGKYFKGLEIPLTHAACLEAVARTEHFKDWATYLAEANREASFERSFDDIRDWPRYVFHIEADDDYVDHLYVLPRGSRVQVDRFGVSQAGATILAPAGFVLDPRVVVTDVHSLVPTIDEYGLPWFADEDKAHAYFHEELGCATTPALAVTLRDTGDDSAARFWFEARVDPEYAKQLESAFEV
jgi:hypothetical protein